MEPYLFFWDEWINHEDCNLNELEIKSVNLHLKNKFKCSFLDTILRSKEAEKVLLICKKLDVGLQIFRDVIVIEFLCTLIRFGKHYKDGFDHFLNTSIKQLAIETELKDVLLRFKMFSIGLLFSFHQADDFRRGWMYHVIVDFVSVKKRLDKANRILKGNVGDI